MKISIVVAHDQHLAIGRNNEIPWHLPNDLKYFKKITSGHCVVMGRKCFESIGKPLPNRTNIIITRDKNFKAEGCLVVHSFDEAEHIATQLNEKELMIIGGGEIYTYYLSKAHTLYITEVDVYIQDAEIFFPKVDFTSFILTRYEEGSVDEKNIYSHRFKKYIRR